MSTVNRLTINGVLNTEESCLDIMNKLATHASSFLTWDPVDGLWVVTVNKAISGIELSNSKIFDDSTIIGSVNFSGSGLDKIYNSVKASYPSQDLNGDTDEVYLILDQDKRYANELDNQLQLTYEYLSDPVQVSYLASVEMLQSRVDTIIEFKTDFSQIDLRAGEIIRITFSELGYFLKPFRIISIVEEDTDDGSIVLNITALLYDFTVYSESGLTRVERNKNNGISNSRANICVVRSDSEKISQEVARSLQTENGQDALTQDIQLGTSIFSVPLFQTESVGFNVTAITNTFSGGTVSGANVTGINEAGVVQFTGNPPLQAILDLYRPIKTCFFNFEGPQGNVVFTVDGTDKTFTALGIPCVLTIYRQEANVDYENGTFTPFGTPTLVSIKYMEWSSYFTQVALGSETPVRFHCVITPLNTYDLSSSNQLVTFKSSSGYITGANGDYATLTLAAFLN